MDTRVCGEGRGGLKERWYLEDLGGLFELWWRGCCRGVCVQRASSVRGKCSDHPIQTVVKIKGKEKLEKMNVPLVHTPHLTTNTMNVPRIG